MKISAPVLGMLAISSIVSFSSARGAEPPIASVGDAAIDGSHYRPYRAAWKFSIQEPGRPARAGGTWLDTLQWKEIAGSRALQRKQVALYSKNHLRLSFENVFEPRTMRPLFSDWKRFDTGEARHVEYKKEVVIYRRSLGDASPPTQKSARLERAVFDFYLGTYGLLLAALPLRPDYETQIPVFDEDRMAIDWMRIRVVSQVAIDVCGERDRKAWLVEASSANYGLTRLWLRKAPPYVLKSVFELGKGGGGTTITYSMASWAARA